MAQADSRERVPPTHSILSSDRDMEMLSPEDISHKMDHPIDNADSTHIIENKLSQMSVSGTACPSEPEHQDSSGLSDNEQGVTYSEDVLLEAGVQIDLDSLAAADGGNAPLELFSQFMVCLATNEHKAAKLLCEKILEFEPTNPTAIEFMSVIDERIKLNEELPSETSSESDDNSSGDDLSFVSSGEESSSAESSSCENKVSSEKGACSHHH